METKPSILEDDVIHCDVCKERMDEGFLVEPGLMTYHFCSKECRRQVFTNKEYNEMYKENIAFWTTWYDL